MRIPQGEYSPKGKKARFFTMLSAGGKKVPTFLTPPAIKE
jgi:hypothetical protein